MGGEDLEKLLAFIQPVMLAEQYVFCSVPDIRYGDLAELRPLASFQEDEGLSLVLEKSVADAANLPYDSVFRGITLSVHSSLEAVGFTAAVSNKLAVNGISANVVAAHYHDHVFVPAAKADLALQLLTEFEA